MSQVALVVLILAIVVVILVVAIGPAAARGRRRLRELPPESKDRYARSWATIEAKFRASPTEAMREADRIAVGILSERGATLHDHRSVPNELHEARQFAISDKGRGGTEGMRQALAYYERIVEDAVGDGERMHEGSRPEVAS